MFPSQIFKQPENEENKQEKKMPTAFANFFKKSGSNTGTKEAPKVKGGKTKDETKSKGKKKPGIKHWILWMFNMIAVY